jgi:hypothetical protein
MVTPVTIDLSWPPGSTAGPLLASRAGCVPGAFGDARAQDARRPVQHRRDVTR